jgi:hypothetical protein
MPRGVPNVSKPSSHVVASTDDFQHADWEGFLDMTAEAPGAQAIHVPELNREFKDMAEYEKFMSMPVGIMIGETQHERESPVVPVGCNGDQKWLPRDVPIMVKRWHLERLLRSTTSDFSVEKLHDPNLDEGQRTKRQDRPVYHVNILKDDHPAGARWAARMRREGC